MRLCELLERRREQDPGGPALPRQFRELGRIGIGAREHLLALLQAGERPVDRHALARTWRQLPLGRGGRPEDAFALSRVARRLDRRKLRAAAKAAKPVM